MGSRRTTFPLSGAVVAITGGGRGIGRATARAFYRAGARVAVGDLDAALAAETVGGFGDRGVAAYLDVTRPESLRGFLETAESSLGSVDVLVNNAGIMPLSNLVDEPDTVTRRIIDINLYGVIIGTKLVAPGMVERGRGHIINLASMGGRVAGAGGATYCASKYAVVGFSEAMRSELAPAGVHVSCVLPTVVTTELSAGVGKVRGLKPVSAGNVAATIVEVAGSPRLETWVPRRFHAVFVATFPLPQGLKDRIIRMLGGDMLSRADRAARAAYEERATRV